jgi:hypothetical protein
VQDVRIARHERYDARPQTRIDKTLNGETLYNIGVSTVHSNAVTIQWFGHGHFLGIQDVREFDYYEGSLIKDTVRIYDTEGGEPREFEGFGQPRWYQNHTLMLYRDRSQHDWVCLIDDGDPDLPSGDCNFFGSWRRLIQDCQWSPDGQQVIFTYIRDDERVGGLCLVDVETREVDCSIQRTVTNGTFGGYYRYSSGNAYGVFTWLARKAHLL